MSNEERFDGFRSSVSPNDKEGKRLLVVLKVTCVAARGSRNASH